MPWITLHGTAVNWMTRLVMNPPGAGDEEQRRRQQVSCITAMDALAHLGVPSQWAAITGIGNLASTGRRFCDDDDEPRRRSAALVVPLIAAVPMRETHPTIAQSLDARASTDPVARQKVVTDIPGRETDARGVSSATVSRGANSARGVVVVWWYC